MTETQRPNWLKPGAEVIVWSDYHDRKYENVKHLHVLRVAGKSFTVDDEFEPRFPIDSFKVYTGTTWNSYYRRVMPADSDQAREIEWTVEQRRRMSAAREAVEKWEHSRTQENRLAAVAALQAIEVDEEES